MAENHVVIEKSALSLTPQLFQIVKRSIENSTAHYERISKVRREIFRQHSGCLVAQRLFERQKDESYADRSRVQCGQFVASHKYFRGFQTVLDLAPVPGAFDCVQGRPMERRELPVSGIFDGNRLCHNGFEVCDRETLGRLFSSHFGLE